VRVALPLLLAGLLAGCADPPTSASSGQVRRVVGGEPERGRQLARTHGCPACHVIPGVGPTRGQVGPSLAGFAERAYIAGRLPNRPDALVLWLQDPTLVDPKTAMPDVGLDEPGARHVAAYLYTLNADRGWLE
jgi:cytochrome c2